MIPSLRSLARFLCVVRTAAVLVKLFSLCVHARSNRRYGTTLSFSPVPPPSSPFSYTTIERAKRGIHATATQFFGMELDRERPSVFELALLLHDEVMCGSVERARARARARVWVCVAVDGCVGVGGRWLCGTRVCTEER